MTEIENGEIEEILTRNPRSEIFSKAILSETEIQEYSFGSLKVREIAERAGEIKYELDSPSFSVEIWFSISSDPKEFHVLEALSEGYSADIYSEFYKSEYKPNFIEEFENSGVLQNRKLDDYSEEIGEFLDELIWER